MCSIEIPCGSRRNNCINTVVIRWAWGGSTLYKCMYISIKDLIRLILATSEGVKRCKKCWSSNQCSTSIHAQNWIRRARRPDCDCQTGAKLSGVLLEWGTNFTHKSVQPVTCCHNIDEFNLQETIWLSADEFEAIMRMSSTKFLFCYCQEWTYRGTLSEALHISAASPLFSYPYLTDWSSLNLASPKCSIHWRREAIGWI